MTVDPANRPRRSPKSLACGLLAAGLFYLLPGCGSKEGRIACYPTTGQVLIGDKPAEGILVRFYDAANPGNVDAPQPYASTDAAGNFSMCTFEDGDGAPAGNYIVVLLWPEGPAGPAAPRDRLGNAFTNPSTTPFKATVAQGATRLDPIKIDPAVVKKPANSPG